MLHRAVAVGTVAMPVVGCDPKSGLSLPDHTLHILCVPYMQLSLHGTHNPTIGVATVNVAGHMC